MSDSLILDQRTLRRIPPFFVFVLVLVLGLPAIALNYFGVTFSSIAEHISSQNGLGVDVVEQQIRTYFRQTLLQWSAFSLAAITVLFSFTQYRLTNDKIALIIGLSVLFSGSVEALHTLIITNTSNSLFLNKENLDALIWTVTNSISGVIILTGLLLMLRDENRHTIRLSTAIWMSLFLLVGAFTLIYYLATLDILPSMWFEYSVLYRPYELIYLIIYLVIILFIYPKIYQLHPYILTNCIFYMAVTEIVIAIYLMLLSSTPSDSAYNIAYFLKIIVYFIPFSCLIINYVFSYNAILEAQGLLKSSEERLKYMAAHDPLTALYNRREFEVILDKTIANAARNKSSFGLFVIDLDNFKSINDTLGHIQGDELLKQFSEKLVLLTRKGDTISRIGGDEFTLITSKLKSVASARKLGDRITKGLNEPYVISGKLLTATVSIGISIFPHDGETTEALLKNADIAMYSSKKSGKNTYRFYTENLSTLQHREAEIESHLRDALKNDEFTLCFQPIFNLNTQEVLGAEVLLRWHSKTLGEVSPDEFIPVAEHTGLIVSIGYWVLAKTCIQAKKWMNKYHKSLVFNVNISPEQFESTDFYVQVKKILDKHHFPAEYLGIDITERLLMNTEQGVNEVINNIDALGIPMSIDDFGMGYSSLSHLKSLPIDTLKIDKLFIADIKSEQEKVIVIDTIIKLAEELGMQIVAEGVETETQLQYLISKNCHLGQGFLLSKPLTAEEFEALVYLKSS